MTDVVVLAGGKNDDAMRAATGVTNRALTPMGDGKTMLDFVVGALRGASSVWQIVVVGDVPAGRGFRQIAGGETLLDNLLAGLNAVGGDAPVLVATADIPFLTPAGVDDFIAQATQSGADICYPIVPMTIYAARFPTLKRTTLKVREGEFTGGNLILVNPRLIRERRETVRQVYDARKSVWQIGRMLGWGMLTRIALAQKLAPSLLPLASLESAVARLLGEGCRAAAIRTDHAEIGTDIDRPEEIPLARDLLAQKTKNSG